MVFENCKKVSSLVILKQKYDLHYNQLVSFPIRSILKLIFQLQSRPKWQFEDWGISPCFLLISHRWWQLEKTGIKVGNMAIFFIKCYWHTQLIRKSIVIIRFPSVINYILRISLSMRYLNSDSESWVIVFENQKCLIIIWRYDRFTFAEKMSIKSFKRIWLKKIWSCKFTIFP